MFVATRMPQLQQNSNSLASCSEKYSKNKMIQQYSEHYRIHT